MNEELVSFIINDRNISFKESREIINLLRNDDEFTINYLQEQINNGILENYNIHTKNVAELNILRNVEIADCNVNHGEPDDNQLWKTRGKQTALDFKASEYLLELRIKYENKFQDKKTIKAHIWEKIAKDMSSAGFNVGVDKISAEKCRQKFQNLSKPYIKFVHCCNKTGEGKIEPPEHYELLHAVYKDKDKINPKCISDSLNESANSVSNENETPVKTTGNHAESNIDNTETASCFGSTETVNVDESMELDDSQDKAPNRFKNVEKATKPTKTSIVDELKRMHNENKKENEEQFNTLSKLMEEQNRILREQNMQKERFLDAFEKMISQNK